MLRGFYTAAAGMIAQQRRQEMMSNNLANATTPGYKADQSSLRAFPEMLMNRIGTNNNPAEGYRTKTAIGSISTGVYLQETVPSFIQGALEETGNDTDLALINGLVPTDPATGVQGSLFFTVQNGEGDVRYTRNGNFTLDGAGNLVTNDGFYVLDANNQPIQLMGDEFSVTETGQVVENGAPVAQINVAFSQNPNQLIKEGSGLFRLENGQLISAINNPNITFQLKQGFLERSNVDVQQTMTDMMTAYRAFEANQKVLQAYDRSLEKAVNEIGRLR